MSTFEEMREDAERNIRKVFEVDPKSLRFEFSVNAESFRESMAQVQKSFAQLAEAMRPGVEAINRLARKWAQLEQRSNFKVKNGRGGRKRRNRRNRKSAEVRPW